MNKFNILVFIVIFVNLVCITSFSDEVNNENKINFYYDYALFQVPEDINSSYLEVYLGIPLSQINTIEEDEKIEANYLIGMRLLDSDGFEVITDFYQNKIELEEEPVSSNKIALEQLTYKVEKGDYTMEIGISDNVSTGVFEDNIEVPERTEDVIGVSDIQLINNMIKSDNVEDKFYKNGYIIVPNPSRMYEIPSDLRFYYELYNIDEETEELTIKYVIATISGRVVSTIEKLIETGREDIVLVDSVELEELKSGVYNLFVEIPDEMVSVNKEFIIYEEERMEELQALYFELMLEPYSDEEAASMGEKLSIIASKEEMDIYYHLDNSLKPYFVYKFWKSLDPDPTTEVNEYKEKFEQRLEYVEAKFATQNLKGWESDRGRVYMKYGEPDEIEREPSGISSMVGIEESTFETEPTEAWVYYSGGYDKGGAIFIFVDFDGDGSYTIFSSTEPGYGRLMD